ncbi:MAG: glycosyltransferase family 39 protein, partial [Flavobacteriales bacterium]|nr:glycosyltransferase family 39 protein [Flavobacteriales bacterium]
MERLIGNTNRTRLFLVFLGAFLFLPFLGHVHLFDWDEINFAEAAREMLVTGDYGSIQIDYRPFWEKPPLFLWMQALSMKTIGVGEYAARLPNALCGILTLLLVFDIGRRHLHAHFGVLWSLCFAGSLLPHLYFKSGIIDPWFNFFIFLGVYLFYRYDSQPIRKLSWLLLSGTAIGLAVLTKGPVAALVYGAVIIVVVGLRRCKPFFPVGHLLLLPLSIALLGGLWFAIEYLAGRGHIVQEFIEYQIRLFSTRDAGHGGPFYYHFVVLLFGCFPASAFALPVLSGHTKPTETQRGLHRYMLALFWVVLILFSVVETKIIHYSSLCYFPLTYAAAYYLFRLTQGNSKIPSAVKITLLGTGLFLGVALTLLPLVGRNALELIESGVIKDVFAVHNLYAPVHWPWFTFAPGLIILIITLLWFVQQRLKYRNAAGLLILGLPAWFLTLSFLVPRIEGYTQNSVIAFYKSLQGQNVYVNTHNFKSYADLFYTAKRPEQSVSITKLLAQDQQWPVYIVLKITGTEEFEAQYPDFNRKLDLNG